MTILLLAILGLPLLGAIANGLIALVAPRRRRLTGVIGVATIVSSFVLTAWLALVYTTPIHTGPLLRWIESGTFSVSFGFTVDSLTLTLLLVITGIGSAIHLYSTEYMAGDTGYARYFSYLNLFIFFMLLLVMSDSLLSLFIGWEGVGLCSYLLIGFWYRDLANARAGKKAFIVNRIGDVGFLVAIFLIYDSLSRATIGDASPFHIDTLSHSLTVLTPQAPWIALCFFIAAVGKSAQLPLYVWLPDAMAGPTPVSALIHAATMVTAGIYLIARLFFLFELAPSVLLLVATIGVTTAAVAAAVALVQTDIKRVLAYSTVSQLGYMMLGLGVGAPANAVFHLFTHAFFKAGLFLAAGSVIHALNGEQDIRKMGGLRRRMPKTAIAFAMATAAISGIPPFSGFISKDAILWETWSHGHPLLYLMAFLSAGLTAFYMMRLLVLVFLGQSRGDPTLHPHDAGAAMTIPVSVLAILATAAGVLNLPASWGGSAWFTEFLGMRALPSALPHAGRAEWVSSGAITLWTLLCTTVAYVRYRQNPQWAQALSERFEAIYHLLRRNYYLDELYELMIVRPLQAFSEIGLRNWVERRAIDGVVAHGIPSSIYRLAGVTSRLQTGRLSVMAAAMIAGILLIMALVLKG